MDEAIAREESELTKQTTATNAFVDPTATIPLNRYGIFIALAAGGGLADLGSKEWVFRWRGLPGELPPWWLVEPYVGIETAVNQGALFGLGQGKGWLFAYVSIAAALGILVWLFAWKAAISKWITVTMGFVTAGIIGNLYDRLNIPKMPEPYSGGVRDWILFTYQGYVWPNFNIADSFLVTGAIMLAIHSLFLQRPSNVPAANN
jgi:signal peptidase II